eukprot:scaffold2262_cov312-Prasinococcus_capsulatus_cf.AAC.9
MHGALGALLQGEGHGLADELEVGARADARVQAARHGRVVDAHHAVVRVDLRAARRPAQQRPRRADHRAAATPASSSSSSKKPSPALAPSHAAGREGGRAPHAAGRVEPLALPLRELDDGAVGHLRGECVVLGVVLGELGCHRPTHRRADTTPTPRNAKQAVERRPSQLARRTCSSSRRAGRAAPFTGWMCSMS